MVQTIYNNTTAQTMQTNLVLSNADDSLFAWEAQLAINLYSTGQTWFNLDTVSMDSIVKKVKKSSL